MRENLLEGLLDNFLRRLPLSYELGLGSTGKLFVVQAERSLRFLQLSSVLNLFYSSAGPLDKERILLRRSILTFPNCSLLHLNSCVLKLGKVVVVAFYFDGTVAFSSHNGTVDGELGCHLVTRHLF